MTATRREFLVGLGAATLAGEGFARSFLSDLVGTKRNILFIMTDDHASAAIGAYGSRINRTPNMDAMAREGMRFTNCVCTNPICTPSRGCILTGEWSCQNGVPVFNDINPAIKTVGGYMRDAGYWTGFIGKWHLGGPDTMRDQDWNEWHIYGGQGQYFDPWFWERKDGKTVQVKYPGEYATENITRLTKEMLDRARASEQPFFLMMHHKAPHRNWLPSPKYHDEFRRLTLRDIPLPETLFDNWQMGDRASAIKTTAMTLLHHMRPGADLKLAEYFREGHTFEFEGRTYPGKKNAKGEYVDDWPEGMNDRAKTALSYLRYMQDYLACVQSVDDSVGEMRQYLKDHDLLDNTVVIYTADQGFFLGEHGLYDKRFILEPTVKMPFIASCPGSIPENTVSDQLICNVDFPATFVDIAGEKKPALFQGRSFWPVLEGDFEGDFRDVCYARYYIEGGEHSTAAWYGLVTKTDKLVYYYKRDEWEYFDYAKDPNELMNGYHKPEYQARIAHLKTRLAEVREQLGDHDQYADSNEYTAIK